MMNSNLEENRYLTAQEASIYLSMAVGSIYNLSAAGKLKSHRLGNRQKGRLRFVLNDLDNFLGRSREYTKIRKE